MKAEERAKKLSKCAGNLEECDGLENLYVFAVEQIRQAEAAARAEEREACAALAETHNKRPVGQHANETKFNNGLEIGAAIRARND